MKNRPIPFILFCLVLFLIYGVGKTMAQIDISKPVLDFGALYRPNAKSMAVTVTNTSSSPFLGTMDVSCEWLSTELSDISLASGDSRELTFSVDTKNMNPGDYEATIVFRDLMGASKAELIVKCVVVVGKDDPVLSITEKAIDFKEVEKGSRQSSSLFIENVGSGILKMKFIYPEWIRGEEELQIHYTQKRPVFVWAFTDDFIPGEYTDEIRVESNGGNETVPVKIKVKPRPDDPILSCDPGEIDFGTVKKGKKGRKKLSVKNIGKGRLTGALNYPDWIEGEEEFKEVEKTQSFLLVADSNKLPYGLTRDVVKLTSDAGILDVPVRIYVEKR